MHTTFINRNMSKTSQKPRRGIKTYQLSIIIMAVYFLSFVNLLAPLRGYSEYQRTYVTPPWAGQVSEFSSYALKPAALVELSNGQINDMGLIQSRSGFYCWLDSVSITEPILGAINYKRWIEGGASEELIFNTNNKVYSTTTAVRNTNTDISGGLSYSDDGIPIWTNFFNDLFMCNGENNPIRYNQDGNCIQLGRCVYIGNVTFTDANEIVLAEDHDGNPYHFAAGMDLVVADSNNNGTYEIARVDANTIEVETIAGAQVTWAHTGAESVTLTGLGIPSDLTTTRTETAVGISDKGYNYFVDSGSNDYVTCYRFSPYGAGLRVGMTLTIANSSSNNGDKGTITAIEYKRSLFNNWGYIYVSGSLTTEYSSANITFTGTKTTTSEIAFNPQTITGHKGRLFAGGVKEYPTRLYYSISRLLSTQGVSYYDMWRDRYGYDDGSGYIIIGDKIQALIPEYFDNMLIMCEGSIYRLEGNDPGFDILTPSQPIIFQPVCISKDVGCVGPNAYCMVGNKVYFMSKNGLQELSTVAAYGNIQTSIMSIPVNDLFNDMISSDNLRKISMVYLPITGNIYINCALSEGTNDSIIVYNVDNKAFSKYTFKDGSEPLCIFRNTGPSIDPNENDFPNAEPVPYETIWMGSEDGKFFAMTDSYGRDMDYEDCNAAVNTAITTTIITRQMSMDDPFLRKTFRDMQIMAREKINYSISAGGSITLYYKIDNGSWSSGVSKTFTTRTDTAGSEIDKYEWMKFGAALSGSGHTIAFKITSANYYGCELYGIMTCWEPVMWEP